MFLHSAPSPSDREVTHGFFTKFVPSYLTLILTRVLIEDQSSFLEYYSFFFIGKTR